ncbi:hypothetical protein CDD83_4609 [Cordyceps sp. RAO-2017]|nr:hypothetical protein CDD83_4609 [Cordyceps sp. RAO-2017]
MATSSSMSSSSVSSSAAKGGSALRFGPFEVTEQVFLTTQHSFALVNLKPLLPGHVLVCPQAPHRRLTDLSTGEAADLMAAVQLTQRMLARTYWGAEAPGGGSFTVAVQDGPEAGQTVPHVHVHVIPRAKGDMAAADDVYEAMAGEAGNVGGALWDRATRPAPGGGMPRIEDADRAVRTPEQMRAEAVSYRAALRDMGVE